jgi:hypothetical protein
MLIIFIRLSLFLIISRFFCFFFASLLSLLSHFFFFFFWLMNLANNDPAWYTGPHVARFSRYWLGVRLRGLAVAMI